MAISYTWSVEDLPRKTITDAVVAVKIKVTATEGLNIKAGTNHTFKSNTKVWQKI